MSRQGAEPGIASDVLSGGGEMGALMRTIDWSKTPLGPIGRWPQSLRTSLSILLETGFPMYIAWGPSFTQFYNDGYRPILGSTKHPAAMGISTRETFAEIWDIIGPMFEGVMRGMPVFVNDFHLPLDRHGFVEECYFVFSYSPIREESGTVGGVLVTVTETTERVLGTRRLRALQGLSEQTANAKSPAAACEAAAAALADARADVPFALFYLLADNARSARLVASVGLDAGSSAAPREHDLGLGLADRAAGAWPLERVVRSGRLEALDDVERRFGALASGTWPEPVSRAVMLPIARPGQERPYGVLVCGVSPRRPLDDDYKSFFSLVAGHAATAVTNARAFEEERRRATELAEAHHLFRTLVDNVPELAWAARPDGFIDFYNQRWYEYTGTTPEEMAGWGWKSVHDPSTLDAVVERWTRSLETGEPFEMEFPLRGADGKFRWFLTRVRPLRDASGAIVRWFGTNTNIHEQRELRRTAAILAELGAVLAESLDYDETLRKLARHVALRFADFCIVDVSDDGGVRRVAVAAKDPERERALEEIRIAYPPSFESSPQPGARALRAGEPVVIATPDDAALRATCVDDRHAALMSLVGPRVAVAAPMRLHGRIVGTITFGFTARGEVGPGDVHLAEEIARRAATTIDNARLYREAKEAEAQNAAILDAALDCVVVMDAAGRIVDFNPAAERTFGRRREDVVGKEMSELLIPPSLRAAHRAGLARYLATGEGPILNRRLELTALHADGSELAVELAVVALRRAGAPLFTAYIRDITERKAAEAERATLLAREKAAREEAERSNRAKDEFLAVVSHELRNPLNAMLGWTRMLRSGGLSAEKQARALETIERSAVNQTQLIEDLLDISRVVSGKLRLEVQLVAFEQIVLAAIESARPAAEAKGIELDSTLERGALVRADPARLQQVVWNLLTNALKFTPKGGSIRVALRRTDAELELSVTDTGEGIAADFLPFVFDRFRQADPSSTRKHGGLGLGLAIAKNVVELHGGGVEARSEGKGHGSTFLVRLPMATTNQAAVRTTTRSADAFATFDFDRPPELDGLRVLVVDDEPDARDLVEAILSACGAVVKSASSAAEAMDAMREARPDVMVSDIGMPGEDGYSLIHRIRELPAERGGSTPAASLTAYASADDRRRALSAGFDMHAAKPIEPKDLVAVVASLGRIARALGKSP